ncbi:MATE family efflux transporter [Maribellus comscasis]|uniref:Multidrug-efflux transporter n=1 Tax=Maribellus comscasis TaxID=2681766 RepID=A0A6I6JXU7_9BACT|nr:MATE family efflux transporter [Maribellus comscasis]QGY47986.1 MATE family efflux transporter [Maribellus comscasis]
MPNYSMFGMKLAHYFPYYRRNLRLALPVVLSQIGQVSVQLIDVMMVGHVGTTELAASAFVNNIFMIGMNFGMGLTLGLTPLVGNAFGNKEKSEVTVWLKNGMFTHIVAALVLTAIMSAVYFFLPVMGQQKDVISLAKPYYLLLCASYLPFILFFSFKQFFEGLGNTKMAMQITLISNVVNIIVNYVLIFGKFGFPAMGLVGAGIGTLVSRIIMPSLFILFIWKRKQHRIHFRNARLQPLELSRIKKVLKIGIPIALQIIVEVTAFGIGAIMMGWLGEKPLAAHQVALGLASFTYMISLGISQANTIRISHQMGNNDLKALKMAAFGSTHLVLAFMSFTALVFVFGKNYLPYLFTTDSHVVVIAAGLLVVAAVFQIFDGLQVVMLSTLRGMADVKIPMFIAFVAYLLIGIPTSYLLTFVAHIGPQGIWFGYLVGLGVAGLLFYFRFKHNIRKSA